MAQNSRQSFPRDSTDATCRGYRMWIGNRFLCLNVSPHGVKDATIGHRLLDDYQTESFSLWRGEKMRRNYTADFKQRRLYLQLFKLLTAYKAPRLAGITRENLQVLGDMWVIYVLTLLCQGVVQVSRRCNVTMHSTMYEKSFDRNKTYSVSGILRHARHLTRSALKNASNSMSGIRLDAAASRISR